jgi:hypothetical protein
LVYLRVAAKVLFATGFAGLSKTEGTHPFGIWRKSAKGGLRLQGPSRTCNHFDGFSKHGRCGDPSPLAFTQFLVKSGKISYYGFINETR